MPTIKIDRKEFEKYVGKKFPDDKLKDRISYLGTDLEEVNDKEIIVEVFPNRPDMLSVQGFARAFGSFTGSKTGLRKYNIEHSKDRMVVESSVKDVRPYTACAIVKELKLNDEKIKEIIDIQEKLHITYGRNRKKVAIGIYPYEKIKAPIRFLAEDPKKIVFQPLESSSKMNALEILEKHPAGKDYGHLLEGKKKFPVFRDANGDVLSMPPIINSHKTGKVSDTTNDVFIECSGYDFQVMKKCLNIIVSALHDMGGRIYSMELAYGSKKYVTPDLNPEEMKVDRDYINKWLGVELKEKEIKRLFERMGYGYGKGKALIPAYRTDILHQTDLAEDVAIAYGYENFEETVPKVATIAEEDKFEVFKDKVSEILIGLGFLEASTYILTNEENQCIKMNTKMELIRLSNSVSSDYDVLRSWLMPSAIEVLASNKHHEYPQKVFNSGRVFKKNTKEETNLEEQEHLAGAIASEDVDYTDIRQVVDYVLNSVGLQFKVEEENVDSLVKGRSARATANGKDIAHFGELSPAVLENWGIEVPAAAFTINLNELFKAIKK